MALSERGLSSASNIGQARGTLDRIRLANMLGNDGLGLNLQMIRVGRAAIAATSLLLCSCVLGASKNMAFNPSSGSALISVASASNPDHSLQLTYHFRPVRLDNTSFNGEVVSLTFSGTPFLIGDELKPDTAKRDKKRIPFASKLVPPGDYALVSLSKETNTGIQGVISGQCFGDMAPVFRLRAGEITIVETHKLGSDHPDQSSTKTLEDFAYARSAYTRLKGEGRIGEPVALIQWAYGDPTFWDRLGADMVARCQRANSFTIVATK